MGRTLINLEQGQQAQLSGSYICYRIKIDRQKCKEGGGRNEEKMDVGIKITVNSKNY